VVGRFRIPDADGSEEREHIVDERYRGDSGDSAEGTAASQWDDRSLLSQLTVTTCAAYVGEPFHVLFDNQTPLTLELIAATPFSKPDADKEPMSGKGRIPFSLIFRGPQSSVLPQRTYLISHEMLGEFPLFLVPIGPDDAGMRYEAAFM
jgi:hypothetical protein